MTVVVVNGAVLLGDVVVRLEAVVVLGQRVVVQPEYVVSHSVFGFQQPALGFVDAMPFLVLVGLGW